MSTVYGQKERSGNVVLKNDTGSDLVQYEFTVIGGLALVADEAIANGATGSFTALEGYICQASDFEAGEDTFGTENADVFWNPATGDFSDTETAGYYKIGVIKEVKNSNGVILFAKARHAVYSDVFTLQAEMAVEQAEPKILVVEVDSDYGTAAVAVAGLVEGDKIIGMKSNCNVTETAGTIQLIDGADAVITDALQQATDKEVAYAATIDKTYSTLPATGAKLVATGTDATAVRCTVVIEFIPA